MENVWKRQMQHFTKMCCYLFFNFFDILTTILNRNKVLDFFSYFNDFCCLDSKFASMYCSNISKMRWSKQIYNSKTLQQRLIMVRTCVFSNTSYCVITYHQKSRKEMIDDDCIKHDSGAKKTNKNELSTKKDKQRLE
jgi:hypothetical protein